MLKSDLRNSKYFAVFEYKLNLKVLKDVAFIGALSFYDPLIVFRRFDLSEKSNCS